jgi:hypothetical protein
LCARREGPVYRRQQHRGMAARAGARDQCPARAGALRLGAELLQPARPRAGAQMFHACADAGRRLHRLQPARGRLADGSIEPTDSIRTARG